MENTWKISANASMDFAIQSLQKAQTTFSENDPELTLIYLAATINYLGSAIGGATRCIKTKENHASKRNQKSP